MSQIQTQGNSKCSICSHTFRSEIELALLNTGSLISASEKIAEVATAFSVSEADLKLHAIIHSPVPMPNHESSSSSSTNSLARQLKIQEADALTASLNEYLITMGAVGRRIRRHITDEESVNFEKLLTKSVTDLYLGTGIQIREIIKLLSEVNGLLNSDSQSNRTGVMALAEAINNSVKR